MWMLYAGLAIFTLAHLWLTLKRNRGGAAETVTHTNGFKGKFALVLAVGLALMIAGWWMSDPEGSNLVYLPPSWGIHLNNPLMVVAFLLFGASHGKSEIRRYIRHPQLWAVVIWGGAHLLANGELRSVVLFGGLAAWAFIDMLLINLRGPWVKPETGGMKASMRNAAISLVILVVFALLHPYLFGVSPFPVTS